jgi:acetyl-CoA carboxylase carboxyltransferase component
MGGEQAAAVMATVKHEQRRSEGRELSAAEDEAIRAPILARFEHEGSPYYATARLWDDGIVELPQTRDALALALSAAYNAPIGEWRPGVIRM